MGGPAAIGHPGMGTAVRPRWCDASPRLRRRSVPQRNVPASSWPATFLKPSDASVTGTTTMKATRIEKRKLSLYRKWALTLTVPRSRETRTAACNRKVVHLHAVRNRRLDCLLVGVFGAKHPLVGQENRMGPLNRTTGHS